MRPRPDSTAGEVELMRATFRDDDLQRAFASDGYVRIRLISEEQAAELRSIWERTSPSHDPGFYPSMLSDDVDYRVGADRAIRAALGPAIDMWLLDHRTVVGNFVIKVPGAGSEVGPHQDWTFVDEGRFAGLTVWCPLVDTEAENGSLRVLPGSHLWAAFPRGTPNSFPVPFEGIRDEIFSASIEIFLRAGEALVYDNRVIHSSAANMSSEVRVAAGVLAVPSEAEIRHVYWNPEGAAEFYRIDDPEFFDSFNATDRPSGVECFHTAPVELPTLGLADLDAFLDDGRDRVAERLAATRAAAPRRPPDLFRRLAKPLPPGARALGRRLWRRVVG